MNAANHVHYISDLCLSECYESRIVEQCNCTDNWPIPKDDSIRFCYSAFHSQSQLLRDIDCIETHYLNVTEHCFKQCKDACISSAYTTEATLSKWPQPSQYGSFYEQIIAPRAFADKFKPLFDRNNPYETNLELEKKTNDGEQLSLC